MSGLPLCLCERIVYRHEAMLLIVRALSDDDIVEVVQDREEVGSEREKVEARDEEKGDETRTSNARSNT